MIIQGGSWTHVSRDSKKKLQWKLFFSHWKKKCLNDELSDHIWMWKCWILSLGEKWGYKKNIGKKRSLSIFCLLLRWSVYSVYSVPLVIIIIVVTIVRRRCQFKNKTRFKGGKSLIFFFDILLPPLLQRRHWQCVFMFILETIFFVVVVENKYQGLR